MVRILDVFYTRGCFTVEEGDEPISMPTSQKVLQRVELNLQHRLMMEQRPLLSVTDSSGVETRTELTFEFRQLLALNYQLLNMSEERLIEFTTEYVQKKGEERMKQVLLFTLAGKIKRTMPKLTWKSARILAKKLSLTSSSK